VIVELTWLAATRGRSDASDPAGIASPPAIPAITLAITSSRRQRPSRGRHWKVGPVLRWLAISSYVASAVIEASVCEHLDGNDKCADPRQRGDGENLLPPMQVGSAYGEKPDDAKLGDQNPHRKPQRDVGV
jgi:hypothetical protein